MPSFFELVKSCATGEAKSYSVAQFLVELELEEEEDFPRDLEIGEMEFLIPTSNELIRSETKRLYEFYADAEKGINDGGYIVYSFDLGKSFRSYGDRFFDDCFRVYTEREFDYNKFLDNTNDLGFVMEFFMKIGLKRPEEELVKYIRKRFLYFTEEEEEEPLIYNETFLAVYGEEEEEESSLDFSDDELGLESDSDVRQMRCTKCGGTEKWFGMVMFIKMKRNKKST